MRWRCRRDDGSVMVKVWKRAAWGDQQREGPRILDFLDRTSELATLEPEGCPKICEDIWLGDAIVIVQQWLDRSEEQTSELKSLMRISYDDVCLKKKQRVNTINDR